MPESEPEPAARARAAEPARAGRPGRRAGRSARAEPAGRAAPGPRRSSRRPSRPSRVDAAPMTPEVRATCRGTSSAAARAAGWPLARRAPAGRAVDSSHRGAYGGRRSRIPFRARRSGRAGPSRRRDRDGGRADSLRRRPGRASGLDARDARAAGPASGGAARGGPPRGGTRARVHAGEPAARASVRRRGSQSPAARRRAGGRLPLHTVRAPVARTIPGAAPPSFVHRQAGGSAAAEPAPRPVAAAGPSTARGQHDASVAEPPSLPTVVFAASISLQRLPGPWTRHARRPGLRRRSSGASPRARAEGRANGPGEGARSSRRRRPARGRSRSASTRPSTASTSRTRWRRSAIPGLGSPILQFVRGGARTLSMELLFDSYEQNRDVREQTDKIYGLLGIERDDARAAHLRLPVGSRFSLPLRPRAGRRALHAVLPGRAAGAGDAQRVASRSTWTSREAVRGSPTESADHTKTRAVKRGETLSAHRRRGVRRPAAAGARSPGRTGSTTRGAWSRAASSSSRRSPPRRRREPQAFAVDFGFRVDGAALAPNVARYVTDVSVVTEPDTLEPLQPHARQPVSRNAVDAREGCDALREGRRDQIELGYADDLEPVFDGEITVHQPALPGVGTPTVALAGYTRLHRLRGSPKTRTFKDVTDTEIARRIATDLAVSGRTPTDTERAPVRDPVQPDRPRVPDGACPPHSLRGRASRAGRSSSRRRQLPSRPRTRSSGARPSAALAPALRIYPLESFSPTMNTLRPVN